MLHIKSNEMPAWNLKFLREHIENKYEDKDHLIELVNSISNYIGIFRYHLYTTRDSLKDFFSDDNDNKPEHLALMLGLTDRADDYQNAKLINQANTIAAIYTVRSIYDVFAQLILGLLLDGAISKERCSIFSVHKKLKDCTLKKHLADLLSSESFQYVSSFANVSKHHHMVKFGSLLSFEEDKAGVRFKEFCYRKKSYPSKWSDEILELTLDTKNRIIGAGIALNEQCAKDM